MYIYIYIYIYNSPKSSYLTSVLVLLTPRPVWGFETIVIFLYKCNS